MMVQRIPEPRDAAGWFALGNARRRAGQFIEAAECFDRVLALDRSSVEARFNLGWSLVGAGLIEEARDELEAALKMRSRDDFAHLLARAEALSWLERFEEQIGTLDRALRLDPSSAAAHLHRGIAAAILGRIEQAWESFSRVVAICDGAGAHYGLARLRPFREGDARLPGLLRMASRPMPEPDRVLILAALGKAYADLGDLGEALRRFAEAARIKRSMLTYDEATALAGFDRLKSLFPRHVPDCGNGSSVPVFIVGMPRSGTSLVEQILASHPAVFGAGERHEFRYLVSRVLNRGNYGELAAGDLTPAALTELGDRYVRMMRRFAPNALRITDKFCENYLAIGLIRLCLPNARIIHCTRDPFDTCMSCFTTLFMEANLPWSYDLGEIGRRYRAYEGLMEHWHTSLPEGAILHVRHEQIVTDLETEARRLIDYCGLSWDDRCLSFHKTSRPVATASMEQVRKPISAEAIGRWRGVAGTEPLSAALGEAPRQVASIRS
jgi:tetratricopeptide (TPR) repeat protein